MNITKIAARFLRPLKNRKGFTFIEAIAVVAIMGILSVTVGSLVTSGVRAYMRQSDRAAMTEISSIIENEIARYITSSKVNKVYLQNGRLAPSRFQRQEVDAEGNAVILNYMLTNAPSGTMTSFFSWRYTYDTAGNLVGGYNGTPRTENLGRVFIADESGTVETYDSTGNRLYANDYFTSNEAEERALYGSYMVDLSFTAIATNGRFYSVEIFADIIDADGNVIYESPGTIATFLDRISAQSSIVCSFPNDNQLYDVSKINITSNPQGVGNSYGGVYIDCLTEGVRYTHLYIQ